MYYDLHNYGSNNLNGINYKWNLWKQIWRCGRVKDGVVTYSEKIVNTTYNKENNNKVVTIQSVNDLIDDCIISNENIAEMKNKDSKYKNIKRYWQMKTHLIKK